MTAGLKYTRNNGPVGGGPYRKMAKDLKSIYEQELTAAGEEGKDEGVRHIESSPSAVGWSGSFRDRNGGRRSAPGPGPGRVHTGKMRDALDYRIVRGKNVGLDVGWIHIWEEYFGAQDVGSDATGYRPSTSRAIKGMGVMAHLRTFMRGSVDEALDRADKRIVNGL